MSNPVADAPFLAELVDSVLWLTLTLNRPTARNAMNGNLRGRLRER